MYIFLGRSGDYISGIPARAMSDTEWDELQPLLDERQRDLAARFYRHEPGDLPAAVEPSESPAPAGAEPATPETPAEPEPKRRR